MAEQESRYTRRKQSKPRRKNVELEAMPEDGAAEGPLTPSQEGEESMPAARPNDDECENRLVIDSGESPAGSPSPNGLRSPMTNGIHCGLEEEMKTEVEKIQEYLRRSDTAVIFPEPVDEESKRVKEPQSDDMLIDYVLKCPHCNKVFTGQSSIHELRDHLSTAHREKEGATDQREKNYICCKCNAAFGEREHLEKHELLHASTNQSCQVCYKSFANVYRLQRHMLSHDESAVLRKFKCPECGKAFKFKHHLKEHIRIHSGEKPFACPNCGKRFSHSGSYSSHMTSKKCLVVNLKVRKMDTKSSRGRGSNQNNAFRPIIPKYGSAAAESVALSPAGFLPTSERFPGFVSDASPLSVQPFLPAAYASVNFHSLLASHFQGHYSPFSGFPDVSHLFHSPPPPHLPPILREKFAENNNDRPPVTTSPTFSSSSPVGPSNNCHPESEEEKADISDLLAFPPQPLKDLNAVKKILQIVDATVCKQQLQNSRNGGVLSDLLNKGSSDSGAESGDERQPSVVNDCCRYCDQKFESRIELHQHERYLCKMNSEVRQVMDSRTPEENKQHLENGDEEIDVSDDQDIPINGHSELREEEIEASVESLRYLKERFTQNPKPKKCEILKITRELGYPLKVVQMWFQRMRTTDKDNDNCTRKSPSPNTQSPNQLSVIHVPHFKPFVNSSSSFGGPIFSQSHLNNNNNTTISLPPPSAHLGTSAPVTLTTPTTTTTTVPLQCLTSVGGYRSAAEAIIYSSSMPETDQPLDLSVKSKTGPTTSQPSSTNGECEVLNLSQKSSRNNSVVDGGTSDIPAREEDRLSLPFHIKTESDCFSTDFSQRLQKNDFMIGHHLVGLYNHARASLSPKLSDTESRSTSDSAVHDLIREGHGLDFPSKYENEEVRPASCSDVASPEGTLSPDDHSADTKASSPFLGEYEDHVDGETKRLYKRIWKQGDLDDGQSPLADGVDLDEAKRRKSWKQHKLDAEEGMYSCDQCDKVFSKQSSLARHKYEHSGQRPHKCDVCHKAFKHKHHLTEHKRLHSGEKPFQCKKCLKRFSHSGSFSQHMNHRYSYCKPYRE